MASSQQPVGAPSPARAVADLLRQLTSDVRRIDLSQSDPVVSGRNAIGLLIPLAVAAALGTPLIGVQMATGALQTAFADRPGPYRLRVIRMLGTALAAGVTAGLAAGLGNDLAASAVLLAVCAFAAGVLLSAGPSAAQVGIAATASALVLGHLPQRPLAALFTGLLVFAGGLVQTLLAIAAWPLRRHLPERRSLAALYSKLAALARDPIDVGTSPPLGEAITDSRAVLRGAGHDHGPSVEAYRVLLDQAQRARRDILVLSAYAERLRLDGATGPESVVRSSLLAAAEVLQAIAEALLSGRLLDEPERRRILIITTAVDESAANLGRSLTEQAAANRLRSLAAQLREMLETGRTGAAEGGTDEDDGRPAGWLRLRDPVAVLTANLDLRSAALRHAARLAVLVPLTDIVTRAAGINRGYWVPLTILVVLRPDFGTTLQRSLMRVLGTLLGLLVTSLGVHYLLGDWQPAMIVLLALLFFGVRMAGPSNLALSSLFLAGLVVVLLSLAGYPAHTTVIDRSIDTAVAGVIALLAVLLWPNWERNQLPDRLSELIGAYRDYLESTVDSNTTSARRGAVRSAARLARSNAEASLDRARAEPVDAQRVVEIGAAVLAHSHRLVHALTAIDASGQASAGYQSVPEFRALIEASLATMRSLQAAVRAAAMAADPPDVAIDRIAELRPLHSALADTLRGPEPNRQRIDVSLVEATDRMVDSLDSIAAVLRSKDEDSPLSTS